MRKTIIHILVVVLSLFLFLGVPTIIFGDFSMLIGGADAVSGASVVVDQPSGEFCVILNANHFTESVEQWRTFFEGGDAGVIFEDIGCLTVRGDAAGIQLAERYQSRLPENQMRLHTQAGSMVLSKAKFNTYEVIIVSKEIAEAYEFPNESGEDVILIPVKGE